MARLARAPAESAMIGAQMGYPYAVQWTGAAGGFRQARRFTPACPMMFLYGRHKPFMFHSAAWAGEVAARPGSRVLAFDAGHWVMVEQPEQFNQAVAEWLAAGDVSR
jgi:pimeloyl-ACP methyl ester carboxylesterase